MNQIEKMTYVNYNYPIEGTDNCFFVRVAAQNVRLERCFSEINVLYYLYSGEIEVLNTEQNKYMVSEGQFFVLPKNGIAFGTVLRDAVIVGCIFSSDLQLFSWPLLSRYARTLSEEINHQFGSMKAEPILHDFYDNLLTLLESGVTEADFHKLKREELFLYLRTFYTRKKLAYFFYPILSGEMDFKDFVLTNYRRMKDVKQFAEEANMTLSTFNRHFKEVFHESAYQWMKANKAEMVRISIITSEENFTEIAHNFGFSSSAHLTAFCKSTFGLTPTELRRQAMR